MRWRSRSYPFLQFSVPAYLWLLKDQISVAWLSVQRITLTQANHKRQGEESEVEMIWHLTQGCNFYSIRGHPNIYATLIWPIFKSCVWFKSFKHSCHYTTNILNHIKRNIHKNLHTCFWRVKFVKFSRAHTTMPSFSCTGTLHVLYTSTPPGFSNSIAWNENKYINSKLLTVANLLNYISIEILKIILLSLNLM